MPPLLSSCDLVDSHFFEHSTALKQDGEGYEDLLHRCWICRRYILVSVCCSVCLYILDCMGLSGRPKKEVEA